MDERHSLLKELAAKLMHDVYYPFTVCVWLDGDGKVLDIYQFDTQFCKPAWRIPEEACEYCLISNHHDGDMRPFDADQRSWSRLKAQGPEIKCRLLLYSEDEGLYEMKSI